MKKVKCYLINNNSHSVEEFKSKKEFKEYIKQKGLKVKKCDLSENWYYTESYQYIPVK